MILLYNTEMVVASFLCCPLKFFFIVLLGIMDKKVRKLSCILFYNPEHDAV